MISIIFALLAYIGAGLGDVFSVVLSRNQTQSTVMLWGFLSRIGLYILLAPFFLNQLPLITPESFFYNFVVGLSSGLGYYFFYKAAKMTNPVLVASIGGSWGASAIVYSFLFLGEKISSSKLIGIGVIAVGFVLVNLSHGGFKNIKVFKDKGILYSFLTMLLWGICGSFLKIPIETHGWFWSTFILVGSFSVFLLYLKFVRHEKFEAIAGKKLWLQYLGYAVLIVLFELSYNIGLDVGNIAVVASIGGTYSTLTVVVSSMIYKEPISRIQKIGVFVTLLGIVVLSVVTGLGL